MGCDIHIFTELKTNGVWNNCDHWKYNQFYGQDEGEPELEQIPIYSRRNYDLFSFLADVRNYARNPVFGFDRGFPDNASPQTKAEYDRWNLDAHTPGYCTLAELKQQVGLVKAIKHSGYVHKTAACNYINTGEKPDEWCQGVGGPMAKDYVWMEWEDKPTCFGELLASLQARKNEVFWLFSDKAKGTEHDEDIRIVFWFDN